MLIDDVRPANRGELVASYKERIAELHGKSAAADEKVRAALNVKLEITRQTAETVKAAKGDLGLSEFRAAVDFMPDDAVKAYLHLARSLSTEPATNDLETSLRAVKEAMAATGALEFRTGHGAQRYHSLNFFSQATSWIQFTAAAFAKFVNRHPLARWDVSEIDGLIGTMQPALRIVRSLNAELQRRNQQ
jgi:hypothetical protein